MHSLYALSLLLSLLGLALLDYHFRLVLFHDWRRAMQAIGCTWLFFVIWDMLGVRLHIFLLGYSRYMTRWQIMPEFPVEELLFLALLAYTPLIIYTWLERRHV